MAIELAAAYVSILPSTKGLGKAVVRDLQGSEVTNASKKAGSNLGGSIKAGFTRTLKAGGLGAAIVSALTIKSGLDRALNIEDAEAKLRGLGKSAKEVRTIMDSALKSVQGTAYGLDKAATVAAGAVAAGIKPGQRLTKYLKTTADASTIAGVSLEEMGAIFNKVQSNQVAYTDDLQQLADRGLPIFQWLQKEYGTTAQGLRKMVQDGKVDSATFQKVIKKNIGGAALESGNTTRGALANLRASLSRIGANLVSGLLPDVKGGAKNLTKALEPIEAKAKDVGAALRNGIERGVEVFKTATPKVQAFAGFLRDNRSAVVGLTAAMAALYAVTKAHAAVMAVQGAGGLVAYIKNIRIVQALTRTWTAVQWALKAAMSANIITLVVVAIAALVAALVIAYKKSDAFRAIVDKAWSVIKAAFSAAWGVIKPVLTAIKDFLARILPPIFSAFKRVIGVVLKAVGVYFKVWWTVAKAIFGLAVAFVRNRLVPAFQAIRDKLRPVFSVLGAIIKGAWEHVIKPTFDRMKRGVQNIVAVVRAVVGAIGDVWSGLKAAFAGPVKWIVDNVINRLIGAVNAVAKALTGKKDFIKKISFGIDASGKSGVVNRGKYRGNTYATGGYVSGPGTGTSDSIMARLSNGEFVIPAKMVKRYGLAFMEAIRAGRLGRGNGSRLSAMERVLGGERPAFAKGGLVGRLAAGLQRGLRWAKTQAGKPYGWGAVGPHSYDCSGYQSAITNVIRGNSPYSRLGSTASMPWAGFKSGPGQYSIGWFTGSPGHTAGTLLGTNVESAGGVGVRVGRGARGAGDSMFSRIMHLGVDGGQWLKGSGGGGLGFNPISRIRNTVRAVSGAASKIGPLASLGVGTAKTIGGFAIDWAKGIAGKLDGVLGKVSPAYNIGKKLVESVFDSGGWLTPFAKGGQVGVNKTKKPEPVLTAAQWAAVKRYLPLGKQKDAGSAINKIVAIIAKAFGKGSKLYTTLRTLDARYDKAAANLTTKTAELASLKEQRAQMTSDVAGKFRNTVFGGWLQQAMTQLGADTNDARSWTRNIKLAKSKGLSAAAIKLLAAEGNSTDLAEVARASKGQIAALNRSVAARNKASAAAGATTGAAALNDSIRKTQTTIARLNRKLDQIEDRIGERVEAGARRGIRDTADRTRRGRR